MNTLTAIHLLKLMELVRVQIAAVNLIGQGAFSNVNTSGALIAQKPDKMQPVFLGTSNNET
jgi:hypothetical protein